MEKSVNDLLQEAQLKKLESETLINKLKVVEFEARCKESESNTKERESANALNTVQLDFEKNVRPQIVKREVEAFERIAVALEKIVLLFERSEQRELEEKAKFRCKST